MNFEEAKVLLNQCVRHELRDHAFGDCEVVWMKSHSEEAASGYFGGGSADVHIIHGPTFKGDEARELRKCGSLGQVERNDETGPDNFVEGSIMPGLTKEGVFNELTGGGW